MAAASWPLRSWSRSFDPDGPRPKSPTRYHSCEDWPVIPCPIGMDIPTEPGVSHHSPNRTALPGPAVATKSTPTRPAAIQLSPVALGQTRWGVGLSRVVSRLCDKTGNHVIRLRGAGTTLLRGFGVRHDSPTCEKSPATPEPLAREMPPRRCGPGPGPVGVVDEMLLQFLGYRDDR